MERKNGIFPGGFNLLHAGHIQALQIAYENCEKLTVILVRDQNMKGHKMYQESIEDRFLKLKALKYVDEVIPVEDEAGLLELMRLLDYDVYFLSEEYHDYGFDEGKMIAGDRMFYLPRKHKWSTTNEVTKIERAIHEEDKSTDVPANGQSFATGGIVRPSKVPILVGENSEHYSPSGGQTVLDSSSDPSPQVQLPENR